MLVLKRKINERIIINNGEVVIQVVRLDRDSVRIGVEAPKGVSVHREEIQESINRGEKW